MLGGVFHVLDTQSMGNVDYRDPRATKWYFHLCWGTVSRRPQMTMRERDGLPCVKFSVCWRRNQYVNYRCWADNPFAYEIAQRLLPGDPVLVCSHGKEHNYVPKKGHNKGRDRVSRESKVAFIVPMRVVAGTMVALSTATEAPDILEGLEEYLKSHDLTDGGTQDYEMPF